VSNPGTDPLDRLFHEAIGRAGGLFGTQYERIGEQEALHYLGALVENGREHWLETLRTLHVPLPDPARTIAALFACIREESLFTDPSFAFSLRLALCDVTAAAMREKADAEELLRRRIDGVFPENLRRRIRLQVHEDVLKDHADGKDLVPSQEAIRRHFEERRKATSQSATRPPAQAVRNPGTDTWLEPCPGCGLEKRCDKKTKWFRCKPCGFDQAYPFESASV